MLPLFSLGILAAITSLFSGLFVLSFSTEPSIVILAIVIPLLEESIKYVFLWKGRASLPQTFSWPFLFTAIVFGLGFALPETLLAILNDPHSTILALTGMIGIHLISACLLASVLLTSTKKQRMLPVLLFILSLALHAFYNFRIFIG